MFIPKGHCQSLTISDLKYIEILTPQKFVAGTIQIQLNYCYKENTILKHNNYKLL